MLLINQQPWPGLGESLGLMTVIIINIPNQWSGKKLQY